MKKILLPLFFLANALHAGNKPDSLLVVLDYVIKNHEQITFHKEEKIDSLRKKKNQAVTLQEHYILNSRLFEEYRAYRCDSAISYVNRNIEVASDLRNNEYLFESKLLFARLLASSGMYLESRDILAGLQSSLLPENLLVNYYECYQFLYNEAENFTQDNTLSVRYSELGKLYHDSLLLVIDKTSEQYRNIQETAYRESGNYEEALRLNDVRLAGSEPGTSGYALATFYRSLIYREMNDKEHEKYYLALSSFSDIQSAIKDHASLWLLAQLLYEEGDIERAYRYIRFSWNETMFYNARLRSWQSAGILSLIDKTYHTLVEKKNSQLRTYFLCVSLLGILLVVALIFIYRQMKKLSVARNNLQFANEQLKLLNEELKQINVCLTSTNTELTESNRIKEEYIGRFMNLCSAYIDKLDAYRRMVNRKIANGKTEELYRMTRSQHALDNELEELYTNFDTAFLQLFPNFVDEFNDLLIERERITLKEGELLNTELRIFALIRLGINDSSRIAEFLRYSVNTIYNYRAKVKNKARISRDTFEYMVMRIK